MRETSSPTADAAPITDTGGAGLRLLPKPAQLENELLPAAEIRDEPPNVVVSDVAGLMMPPSDCPDRPDANSESSLPSLSRPKPVRLSRTQTSSHPQDTHTSFVTPGLPVGQQLPPSLTGRVAAAHHRGLERGYGAAEARRPRADRLSR